MPRSPWRDAIDGKIEVLRGLRGQGALLSLTTYCAQANSLENVPSTERRRRAERMALELRRQLQEQVTLAEPFALTHDIQDYIVRQVNLAGAAGPQPTLDAALARTHHRTDPPVPSGFVWLHEPVAVCCAPPDLTIAELDPGVLSPDRELVAGVVRAILFNPAAYARPTVPHPDPTVPTPGAQSLRIVAFIDGDARNSAWGMALSDQGRNTRMGLVPVYLPHIVEGEPLTLQIEALLERYKDDLVDQTIHAWPTMFLFILFEMMRQKVLLWSGSGLERDARKAAERAGLKPIVQVVTWRKAEYRYPEGHIPTPIEWSCHWSVRPHTRRLKSGKVVQVRSHVKGDRTKDFKAPNQRVNLVKR